jgi:hypothetical protein
MISCNYKSNEKSISKVQENRSPSINKDLKVDTSRILLDTVTINKQKLVVSSKNQQLLGMRTMNGDTVVPFENYYFTYEILDIDKDANKDIRVFVFSNTPNQCDNYLFDKTNNRFRLVENCYLDIQLVKGTKLFYSYNRAGCADMDWESYLSRIDNFKLVNIGYIYGQGCENPQEIEVYKVKNNDESNKELIAKLPYLEYIPKFDYIPKFTKDYWGKNSNKFIE